MLGSEDSSTYLQKLALEADFYMLGDLSSQIADVLREREDTAWTYKIVTASRALLLLDQSCWQFVSTVPGELKVVCAMNPSSAVGYTELPPHWVRCHACNVPMTMDAYMAHLRHLQPTMIMLRKQQN